MKMQRSHCESENVQFVQELAEVDGPFESPIDINFRDLTKLELPPLMWNRCDSCPKKMKITNTGHTVIISGKWKCERPYLTGGPLQGKYVFSQIHFHWGPDDSRGSEHMICGEGFPLEMHVAHFKTEYLTQECALREKDGMVIVVYLFKLQDEPNYGLKKIMNLLPCVREPNTSQAIDPRPILSLCNPFTDDYFMYWGSVVTSTCAHILLWIVCREPYGISREQVREFRKILDASQQPIHRNSRDTQPLHRRNVFHVNASKHLNDPLLPVKKMMGCFCRGNEDNSNMRPPANSCACQNYLTNQEDIEGRSIERGIGSRTHFLGHQAKIRRASQRRNSLGFARRPIFVHRATIHSAPLIPIRLESDPIRHIDNNQESSNSRVTQSCCFFPKEEVHKIKNRPEKRKTRDRKRAFNTMGAFSHIMDSLEALKHHTFKKLKEIDAINQEVKGMENLCRGVDEDTRWLRKIEKIMARQKRFTIRTSQACFKELKKLARECNFDKFFENKTLSVGDANNKIVWLTHNNGAQQKALPCSDICLKEGGEICKLEKIPPKGIDIGKALTFSTMAQKLIQSFFEDIKESESLQKSVRKDLQLKKIGSVSRNQGGDLNPATRGYITQKMFTLGNLGDRFFTEVTGDDIEIEEKGCGDKENTEVVVEAVRKHSLDIKISNADVEDETINPIHNINTDEIIPLHRADVAIEFSRTRIETTEGLIMYKNAYLTDEGKGVPHIFFSDTDSASGSEKLAKTSEGKTSKRKKYLKKLKEFDSSTCEKLIKSINTEEVLNNVGCSSSNLSMNSEETQRMIIAKLRRRQSTKEVWEQKSSLLSKGLYEKRSYKKHKLKNINLEGYYIKQKRLKNTRRKEEKMKREELSSCEASSGSNEKEVKSIGSKSKWKRLTRAKFKLEIQKTSDSTLDSAIEYYQTSPERKKLKLEDRKAIKTALKRKSCLSDSDTQAVIPSHNKRNSDDQGKDKTKREPEWVTDKEAVDLLEEVSRLDIPPTSSRASSIDSRATYSENPNIDVGIECKPPLPQNEHEKREMPSTPRIFNRNKSLTNLAIRPRSPFTDRIQRVFVENLEDRIKSAREVSELSKKFTFPKSPRFLIRMEGNLGTSNETYRKPDKERETSRKPDVQESHEPPISPQEYNVGFFISSTKQPDGELMPISQQEDLCKPIITNKLSLHNKLNLCDTEIFPSSITVSDPKHQEAKEECQETPRHSDSAKSLTDGPNMKGDADPVHLDTAELPTSVAYPIKKNPQSRPHSAESLHSSTKAPKRKGKKRPHCCKRVSKHYIRKNSSVFKKLHKIDSKPFNIIGLTEEEQLKIISANVAKYLKQKLDHSNNQLGLQKKYSFKELEEVVLKNLKDSEQKPQEAQPIQKVLPQTTEVKQKEVEKKERKLIEKPAKVIEAPRRNERPRTTEKPKPEEVQGVKEPPKVSKTPPSTRPVHNFIKLNKQMAGKFRRTGKIEKKNEETPGTRKPKVKPQNKKKKEKGGAQNDKEPPKSSPPPTEKAESPRPLRSSDSSEEPPSGGKSKGGSALTLQKFPHSQTRWMPTYMLTSYLPAPFEIVENQQRKMNRYFSHNGQLQRTTALTDDYFPSSTVLYDCNGRRQKMKRCESDPLFKKDLEYLIRLQMCLNNEISDNVASSKKYIKTLLTQEHGGTAIIENESLYESHSKGLVLIEMNDLLASTSSMDDFSLHRMSGCRDLTDTLHSKEISRLTLPQESGDTGIINPALLLDFDNQEGYSSDSSYNCEISITLNAGVSEGENELQVLDPNASLGNALELHRESLSPTTTHSDEHSSSQSVVLKQHRKKRKDNEISSEMKQKLLEILEDEIKREVAANYGASWRNSSEGVALLWEDTDGMNRSPSTDSNSTDVVAEMSETMLRYLNEFRERRLADERETLQESKGMGEEES